MRYADDSIARKQARIPGSGAATSETGDDTGLASWKAYRAFTAHAIMEVESGALDEWFEHLGPEDEWRPIPGGSQGRENSGAGQENSGEGRENSGEGGGDEKPRSRAPTLSASQSMQDASSLSFSERKSLMDGLITPRPLVLASTFSTSEEGGRGVNNLAGLSSLALVSNHPPQVVISLSQDRQGRSRDTLLNLRQNAKITLHILAPNFDSANAVDLASRPIPREDSEWGLLDLSPIQSPSGDDWPVLFPAALAALECELLAEHTLPEGAVATLCVLAVRRVVAPKETLERLAATSDLAAEAGAGLLDTLCQHGSYRLTHSPRKDAWGHDCSPE